MIVSHENLTTEYSFPPLLGEKPTRLILGSMPSVQSLKHHQYYAHPRNAFWPIMAELFGFSTTLPYSERCAILIQQHIAVWDVLKACQREGSLDSNIKKASMAFNDFNLFLQQSPAIQCIIFNGSKAEQIFVKEVLPSLDESFSHILRLKMPSTSPAHASISFEQKRHQWHQALIPNHDA